MKLTISLSDGDHALLQEKAKQDYTNAVSIAGQIISCWAADQRRDKRLRLPAHHYTSRGADDFADSE